MRKILLFIFTIVLTSNSYALKTENFELETNEYLTEDTKIKLIPKNINYDNIEAYIGTNKLQKISSPFGELTYKLPEEYRLTPTENTIKLKVYDKQSYKIYKIGRWPILTNAEVKENKDKKELELSGYFTGNCNLYVGENKKWKLEIRGNYAYAEIPEKLDYDVYGGYVDCDNLKSNWLDFSISKAPYIRYIISEDKGEIQPGKTILIKGDNFKLDDNDKVELYINGDIVTDFLIPNKNTIKYTLANKNDKNLRIKIKRNDFVSNEIKIEVIKYPYIEKVNIITKNGKDYFRLLGYFPEELGDTKVRFNGKTINIDKITEEYIDVEYPSIEIEDNEIKCSYYIKPGYFTVEIGKIKSNNYFYYKINSPKIISATIPLCANGSCSMTVYFNKNLDNGNININNKFVDAGFNGSNAIVYLDDLVKKGKINYIGRDCVVSPSYEFDFSEDFRPIIREITSDNYFKSASRIDIAGEKINNDGTSESLNVKLSLKPDVLDKDEKIVKGLYSITAFLKNGLIQGDKIDVSLSNSNGKSNGGYFIIGGAKSYMGNPYIKYISYENGGEGGQKAIIKGLNFSNSCNENEIYFGDQVIYPDECDYSKLEFTIPKNKKTDEIYLIVKGQKSEKYKLNSTIGGVLLNGKKFKIYPELKQEIIDLQSSKPNKSIKLNINNTLTDIYISKLKFKITGNSEILPFYEFTMKINNNPYKSYYSYEQKRFIKSKEKNIGYISKTNNGYELIFENVIIPFNTDPNEIEIEFKINPLDAINNTMYQITIPKQTLYYYNLYTKNLKPFKKELDNKLVAEFKLINKPNICFDVEKNFKHCSLALKGGKIKFSDSKNTNIETKKSNIVSNKPIVNQNKQKTLSKTERIANKLTVKKMTIINDVLKKFILEKKKIYWGKEPQILYVLGMYKGWKKMITNTKEDYQNKLEYVNGLIEFAKSYYQLKKNK